MTAPGAAPSSTAAEDAADQATDDLFDGAGVVSSVYDLTESVQEQDAAGIAAAGTAAGLAALATLADPLGAFAEAGLGWAMEHVSWLREPLDRLCGDPGQIEDRAKAWQALSRTLSDRSAELATLVPPAAQGWSGAAADTYLGAADAHRVALDRVARTAGEVARLVLESGAMVGTERALIRDAIASFVVSAVKWLIVALGSGGVGTPVAVTAVVADAAVTAATMADRVAAVADELGRLSGLADELGQGFGLGAAGAVRDGIARVPGLDGALGAGTEAAKQDAAAGATARDWAGPPAD